MDRRIAQDKIIGFALGLGKQDRTATGSDFSGDIDTTQYTLSTKNPLLLSWSALLLMSCVALATPSTASILPLLLSSNAP
jgi:hypothetical protein